MEQTTLLKGRSWIEIKAQAGYKCKFTNLCLSAENVDKFFEEANVLAN